MSSNLLLLPIQKDTETIRITVLTNIIKALSNRGWIKSENIESKVAKITKDSNDEQLYEIKLDVNLKQYIQYEIFATSNDDFKDNVVYVKLVPQKVTSIGKSPIISDFLTSYKNYHKILVVDSISDKSKNTLITNSLNAGSFIEIFNEPFFMRNLLEHECSPQYEILSVAQGSQLISEYNLAKRQMKIMFDSEAASQYLFLKKGKIVRIIRNSPMTGKSIEYRIVAHRN